MKKIERLAIANRGEVAVRIILAAQELGIETVLLHSEPDRATRAFRMADLTVCIGGASSSESYLNIDSNINGAKSVGADALHPGFGFLSENSDFSKACEENGILFVGPSPEAIQKMGDKITARSLMENAGVPLVPGYDGEDQKLETLKSEANRIGFPLMIKAAAGGGGRGLKVARTLEEFESQLNSAKREGLSAFGSEKIFLEKYVEHSKHIEFQVFGDKKGNYVHLFERECSVQRRHQKIVEESPSPSLNEELREKMAKSAIEAARSVNYTGAGTVEFLLDGENYYFLEMNTRLQVEHPVTEMVLGVDLVKAQIAVAEGRSLPWIQEDLFPRGHSIECRVYAEDPFQNGIPSTGPVLGLHWATGPGRRFEYGFDVGDKVSSFYDSMIAKVIVHSDTRDACIQKCVKTLNDSVVFGVKTNFEYLKSILNHPKFQDGTMTTSFIQDYFSEGLMDSDLSEEELAFVELAQKNLLSMTGSIHSIESPFEKSWRNV